jgi:hypothetical protein
MTMMSQSLWAVRLSKLLQKRDRSSSALSDLFIFLVLD